ncbi:MAG: hypothetical protein KAY37_07945, partial [Phycisphaerae bacterium]|nr:hypothetical protein [Phycisphaerae bacterium]
MKKWSKVVCIWGGLLICTAALQADERWTTSNELTSQKSEMGTPQQTDTPVCETGYAPFEVYINTDYFPEETTWKIVEHPSMTIVASGGPYDLPVTEYYDWFCVPETGCYHFVIQDSYGDGFSYPYGSYDVYYDGTPVGSGSWFWFFEEWVYCIGSCPPDCGLTQACCVGNICYDVENQAECDALAGVYYADNMCSSFVCPQSCPPDTIWGQVTDDCRGSWSAATSGRGAGGPPVGFWYRVFENFPELACEIDDIHWWGLLLHYDAGWLDCANPAVVPFLIQFWADVAGMPDYQGTPVCTYGPLFPNYTALGAACGGHPLFYFWVDPLSPPCFMLSGGWVSIESTNNYPDPDCVFHWMSAGGGVSMQWEVYSVDPPADTGRDRGLCLTGPCSGQTGACCYEDGSCVPDMTQADCDASGGSSWIEGDDCDPNNCPQPYVPECPPNTIWGQPSMSCLDHWAAATSAVFPGGDPEYVVYENFAGLPCEVLDMHWWGFVLRFDGGWFACPDPLGMAYRIKFYQDNGGVPGTEVCTYDVVPTPVLVDVCSDVYPQYEFDVDLPLPCFITDGWISIQSQEDFSNECVFRWFSNFSGDGDSLQEDVNTGEMWSTGHDRAVCLTGPPPRGACCLPPGNCVDDLTMEECEEQGGQYMGDDTICVDVYCQPQCPQDALWGQPAHGCWEAWTTLISDARLNRLVYENFSDLAGNVCDIHWWGQSLYWDTGEACDPVGMMFYITFYPDDGTGLPDYTNPLYTYINILPSITLVDNDCADGPLWYFEADLTPCCAITNGWVSIWSTSSSCVFHWFSSPTGDGRSLQWQGTWPPEEFDFDLAVCLTTPVGACCHHDRSCEVTWEANCTGDYLGDGTDCGPPDPCVYGACCVGESCTITLEVNCTGTWLGPAFDCEPINPCLLGAC